MPGNPFFCHKMRTGKLEHLVTTGMIEGKQQEKMFNRFIELLNVKVIDALKATRDQYLTPKFKKKLFQSQ